MKNKNGLKEKNGGEKKDSVPVLKDLLAMNNVIYVYGRRYMMMEGCKKIIKCDVDEIIFKNEFEVKIHGSKLALRQLGNNVMGVEGIITSIEFLNQHGE